MLDELKTTQTCGLSFTLKSRTLIQNGTKGQKLLLSSLEFEV